jgi:endonuclease/exonuclease/phosphatase family metal-dependent hydrolase
MNSSITIGTWNVERPNRSTGRENARVVRINTELDHHPADIMVLTETNDCVSPGEGYSRSSSSLLARDHDGYTYEEGERRVSIYSRFPLVKRLEVTNPDTTVCARYATPFGPLTVYGCIIGILGNRDRGFRVDLQQQMNDLSRLNEEEDHLCYVGDFNLTFCDGYYSHSEGKEQLEDVFSKLGFTLLTRDIPENVDHIAISDSFLAHASALPEWTCWNVEQRMARPRLFSDHTGVMVTLRC